MSRKSLYKKKSRKSPIGIVFLAFKLGFVNKLNTLYLLNIIKYGKLTCELCHNPLGVHSIRTIDHIVPKSLGGSNRIGNLQLAHKSCNSRKGNKI